MMENKIEVGDYIRTKEFGIAKIIYQISESGFGGRILEREYRIDRKEKEYGATYKEVSSKDIVKHSKNIIDLIEVGDYVNGYPVIYIYEDHICVIDFGRSEDIYESDINSLVTKEMFKSVEYKVGE